MAEKDRAYLKLKFWNGERPRGEDFTDFLDSFVSKIDDQVSVDLNTNLSIPGGVTLGTPANGTPGTLRFSGGNVQVFNGGIWNNVGGSAGAFVPVLGGPHVAFSGGNVGIGAFPVAPTFKFEVDLAAAERVRFGPAAVANGAGNAQFSHNDMTADPNFALRQNSAGAVILNAPTTQTISIMHNRTTARLVILPTTGQVIVGNNAIVPGGAGAMFQVNGTAFKLGGGANWDGVSDGRYKKDVKDFKDGLDKLLQVRTVSFKYDGLPGIATKDQEEVGIIGQEMQKIFPYMISRHPISDITEPSATDDILTYNSSALTYVMVNAIQELATRVKELEGLLEEANSK
ncbi:MAG: tail fiber domain-containing protein [Chitinophagaceae bacterium]